MSARYDVRPGQILDATGATPTLSINKRHIEPDATETEQRHILKVLTYNIWDQQHYWQERLHAVIRTIKENAPDVVSLLDVNVQCLEVLNQTLSGQYIVFEVFQIEGAEKGIVLLCRRGTVKIPEGTTPYYYDYNSGEGRVIGVEIEILSTGNRVHVLATKFDDHPDNDYIREEQFGVVKRVIKPLKQCIVMGDFNVYGSREGVEKALEQSKLTDTWIKLGCPPRARYTYNGKRNTCVRDKRQLRASRVYFTDTEQLDIRSYCLLGLAPISEEVPIPPSCHYGVLAAFQSNKRH